MRYMGCQREYSQRLRSLVKLVFAPGEEKLQAFQVH